MAPVKHVDKVMRLCNDQGTSLTIKGMVPKVAMGYIIWDSLTTKRLGMLQWAKAF